MIRRPDGNLYYDRYGARDVDNWLFWGPEVLEPYLRTLGPPCSHSSYDVAFGGFALLREEKRLVWFGGTPSECPLRCRLFLHLQRAIWPDDWTIEWAGRGFQTLLKAAGWPPEKALEVVDRDHLYEKQFQMLGTERIEEFIAVGAATIRNSRGELSLFPLHDGDVTESYLWAGPERILERLSQRLPREELTVPDNRSSLAGGFHLDFQTKTLSHWSHDPIIDPIPPEPWTDWKIVDWEERYEEQVKATDGRLKVIYPSLEKCLAHLERYLVAEEPWTHDPYREEYQILDDDLEEVERVPFPVTTARRVELWKKTLRETGLDEVVDEAVWETF